LKIPLPLLNLNIIIKRSKHSREIKGLFQTVLPNNINSDKDMAHCFNNFFCQNILNIHSGFHSSTLLPGKLLVEESCISMMDTFEPFTETNTRQLLKRSSNAFCAVNAMPKWLVKDYLNVLISPITNIVNKSLYLGIFPRSMKAALVKPLIKNHTVDCNILNNYRVFFKSYIFI